MYRNTIGSLILLISMMVSSCSLSLKQEEPDIETTPTPMTGELLIGKRSYSTAALFHEQDGVMGRKTDYDDRTVKVYIPRYTPPLRVIMPKTEELWKLSPVQTDPADYSWSLYGTNNRYVKIVREDALVSEKYKNLTLYETPVAELPLLLVDGAGLRQTIRLLSAEQNVYTYADMPGVDGFVESILAHSNVDIDKLLTDDDFWQW